MLSSLVFSLLLISFSPTLSDYSCVDELDTHPVRNEYMLQIILKSYKYYDGKIDGNIGPISKAALKTFQSNNNLVVDGLLGPNTCLHLLNRNNIFINSSANFQTEILLKNEIRYSEEVEENQKILNS